MTEATRISTHEARGQFAALIERAANGERFVVTLYDRERAAVVSAEDLRRLEALDAKTAKKPKRK